jgi:hypothetical protein
LSAKKCAVQYHPASVVAAKLAARLKPTFRIGY